jgi:hypothetical protein
MLGYELQDLDRMKFALNMASFYLPPSQEDIKKRLEEVHSFLDGLLAEGYFEKGITKC